MPGSFFMVLLAMMMFHLDELENFVSQGLLAFEEIPEMCLVKFFTGNESGEKIFNFQILSNLA